MASLGRAPRQFRIAESEARYMSADFDVWLEDLESYFALQSVDDADKRKAIEFGRFGVEEDCSWLICADCVWFCYELHCRL